jgi:hypothetical protein
MFVLFDFCVQNVQLGQCHRAEINAAFITHCCVVLVTVVCCIQI